MSKPLKIDTQFLPQAEPQPKAVPVQIVVADAGVIHEPDLGQVEAPVPEVTPLVAQAEPVAPASEPALMLPVLPFWAVLAGWVLCVILIAQGGKWVGRALGIPERLGPTTWSRWVLMIPLASGMLLALFAGPMVAGLFGLEVDRVTSAATVGLVSGPAAVFGYEAIRRWILPVVPTVLALAITKITGIELPERLIKHLNDASGLRADSEAMDAIEEFDDV